MPCAPACIASGRPIILCAALSVYIERCLINLPCCVRTGREPNNELFESSVRS